MVWKWNRSYDEDENLDWLIVRNGPILKYFSQEILEKDITELEKMRYQVIELSMADLTDDNVHKKIQESLDFPDYYGCNMEAFEDCLNDKFNKKYKGLVIVLHHFDTFYSQNKDFSYALMDGIASVAWSWLLAGQKLIGLVQSDDPDLVIDKIGGFKPGWNGEEWLDGDRK